MFFCSFWNKIAIGNLSYKHMPSNRLHMFHINRVIFIDYKKKVNKNTRNQSMEKYKSNFRFHSDLLGFNEIRYLLFSNNTWSDENFSSVSFLPVCCWHQQIEKWIRTIMMSTNSQDDWYLWNNQHSTMIRNYIHWIVMMMVTTISFIFTVFVAFFLSH